MIPPFLRQVWTIGGVLLNIVGLGFMLGYPTSILPALRSNNEIPTDSSDASWIASCVGLASIPGLLLSCYLMEKCGRRLAHALTIIPGIIGWMIIYMSKSVTAIIIGRCFNGFTSGATVTLGAIVIGEYSSPEYRGMFLNLKTAATCAGIISVHVLGNYFHWRTVSLLGAVAPLAALIITLTWPESPSWLATKMRLDESEQSFYSLRGKSDRSSDELQRLFRAQTELLNNTAESRGLTEEFSVFLKVFTKKNFYKPTLIIVVSFLLLEACGRHTFPAYAVDMINGFNSDKSQTFYYTLGIDIITTTTSLFASIIVRMFKRRTLLFCSGISSLIVLLVICLYLFLVSKQILPNDKAWIPLSLFGLYFVLANLGCTPIPLALLGEIFPLYHKSVATAVSGILLSLILMTILKITPAMIETIEVYGTLTVFAACMAGTLAYLYLTLPETENRTLQEIEDFFIYGRFRDNKEEINDEKDASVKLKMLNLTH